MTLVMMLGFVQGSGAENASQAGHRARNAALTACGSHISGLLRLSVSPQRLSLKPSCVTLLKFC